MLKTHAFYIAFSVVILASSRTDLVLAMSPPEVTTSSVSSVYFEQLTEPLGSLRESSQKGAERKRKVFEDDVKTPKLRSFLGLDGRPCATSPRLSSTQPLQRAIPVSELAAYRKRGKIILHGTEFPIGSDGKALPITDSKDSLFEVDPYGYTCTTWHSKPRVAHPSSSQPASSSKQANNANEAATIEHGNKRVFLP